MGTNHPYADTISTFAGTRNEFLAVMKSLGARIESRDPACLPRDPLRVSLRCSANNWVRAFGPVQILAVQFGSGGRPAFQAWQYRCVDGSVLCVGCQYERVVGENWVTVRAVLLS
jgi:hypothetical protein